MVEVTGFGGIRVAVKVGVRVGVVFDPRRMTVVE